MRRTFTKRSQKMALYSPDVPSSKGGVELNVGLGVGAVDEDRIETGAVTEDTFTWLFVVAFVAVS
jgi:hypothetical protein